MRPQDRSYLESHEWALLEDNIAIIGITDFAVEQLGELVFLELPETGITVDRGDTLGEIESVKAVSEFYSPVAGTVTEVNTELPDALEPLQENPLDKGWLVKIQIKDATAVEGLLDAAGYEEVVSTQS